MRKRVLPPHFRDLYCREDALDAEDGAPPSLSHGEGATTTGSGGQRQQNGYVGGRGCGGVRFCRQLSQSQSETDAKGKQTVAESDPPPPP